jgi:HAD superfamily hydrolase (TIGR01509 family)
VGKIRGVLLDVDGTLVDSNDAHALAWVEALRRNGYEASFDEVRPLIGMGADNLLPRVTGVESHSPEAERLSKSWEEIFMSEYLPKLKPTRGAEALVRHMRDRGLKLVVASSAEQDVLVPLLQIAGIERLIDDKTTASDVGRSKPAPDIVQTALRKIGLPAGEVMMLGDTPYDIESATKSGVGMIALRCGGWDDAHLRGAVAIYDDPADLLAHYDESPLG